jgi:tetratricopeptide (TPR) repeat protein
MKSRIIIAVLLTSALSLCPGCVTKKVKSLVRSLKNDNGYKMPTDSSLEIEPNDTKTPVHKTTNEEMKNEAAELQNANGLRACQKSDYHTALSCFQQAVRLSPEVAEYRNNLGRTWYWLGEYDLALQELKAALALAQDNVSILSNIGDTYRQKGDYAEAVKAYHNALEIKPDFARLHYELGNLFLKQNEMDKAEYRLNKAIMLDGGYNRAILARVILYHLTDRDLLAWEDVKTLQSRNFDIRPDLKNAILEKIEKSKNQDRFRPAH